MSGELTPAPSVHSRRIPTFTEQSLEEALQNCPVAMDEVMLTEESQVSGWSGEGKANSRYLASPHFCDPSDWGGASGKVAYIFSDEARDPFSDLQLEQSQMTLEDVHSHAQRCVLTPLVSFT